MAAILILYVIEEFFRCYLKAKVKWEPRDIWVGLYWTKIKSDLGYSGHLQRFRTYRFYLCIIPCLPIIWDHIQVRKIDAKVHYTKEMQCGAFAYGADRGRDTNPHQKGTQQYNDWDYGWVETENAVEYHSRIED